MFDGYLSREHQRSDMPYWINPERYGSHTIEGSMGYDHVDPWVYVTAEPSVEYESWSRPTKGPDRCSYTPPAPECEGRFQPLRMAEKWVPPELDEALPYSGSFAQKQSLSLSSEALYD